jgi:signal transduction histidine kinase
VQERLDSSVIGELLGLLAHDLRNPLSALHSNLGFLHSTLGEAVDPDTREAVDDGLVSCDGLAHIIDNIELLGQALQEGERREPAPVDLGAVATEAARAARSMAQSHGVQIVLSPSLGPEMTGDGVRELLDLALGNLLRNSIQHSPSGASVRVTLQATADEIRVKVEDDGSSLSGAVRNSAFTAMGQLTSKSVPKGRYSRGLGLYSAALAAAATGATVRVVQPSSGAGNAFELLVPRSKQ